MIYEKYPETGDPVDTVVRLDHDFRDTIDYEDINDESQIFVPYSRAKNRHEYPHDCYERNNGTYHTIVSGISMDEPNVEQYHCNVSDGRNVYRMIVKTPAEYHRTGKNHKGYLIDSLYHLFSKSTGDTRPVTSYKGYLNDDNR